MKKGRRHVAEANARHNVPANLPRGWTAISLGDVLSLQPGYAFKSSWFASEGVKLLRGTNIEPGRTRWRDVVCVPASRAADFEAYRLNVGDVVIAMDRPIISTGLKVAVLTESDVPSLLLQRVGRFQCGPAVVREFVQVYLQSALFLGHIETTATGTQLPHISGTDIETAPLLLPPVNEQRRIVAKLEALQTRSRHAREALDVVPPLLEKLRQSILAAAFRGDLTKDWRAQQKDLEPATELLKRIRTARRKKWESTELAKLRSKSRPPTVDTWKEKYLAAETVDDTKLPALPKGWCWASAEELMEPGADIVYGIVQPGPVVAGGVPYVRGTDIRDGRILEDQLLRTHSEIAARYARAALKGGDVLLGIIRATKVAIVPESLSGANITQGTARFRPVSGLQTRYLAGWLDSLFAQNWLHARYRGIDMPGLNLQDVRRLPVPLAPIQEQVEVDAAITTALGRLGRLRDAAGTAIRLDARLSAAILVKAFRGELVPQDPSDEPAEAMLARAHSTSGSAPANGTPQKRGRPRSPQRADQPND